MKSGGDSTHPCRSPTPTVNGGGLTSPTWTQTYERKYSDLTASHRRPSTPTPATLPKAFHKEPGDMLSRGRQNMLRCLWHIPKISQNFAGGWNVVCNATAVTKTECLGKSLVCMMLVVDKPTLDTRVDSAEVVCIRTYAVKPLASNSVSSICC